MLTCGTTQMDTISDVLSPSDEDDDEYDDDSRFERPNRGASLMEGDEDDDDDDDESGLKGSMNNNTRTSVDEEERVYHHILKTAVLAEGQEAMWLEDEVSTVASVFVKPQVSVEKNKKKSRFRLRHSGPTISIPEDEEIDLEEAQKVHVRKKKVMKTVVLLPQQGDDGVKTLVEANVQQEAAANMVKARQLLNQALIVEGGPTLAESEALAKVAFAHAAAARRLMSKPEDEPDLDDVLSILAEKGEHAAFQHQKIVFSQSFATQSVDEPKPKKKGMLSSASEYANRAIHYLESILPKNVDKELQESFSDAADTVSTLGLKNDTFEYQMQPAPSQPTRSYTNMDLMSISSLNEILDGPLDETNENKPPSPRQMLPVIDVPIRTPKTKSADSKTRSTFSEQFKKLVSPTSHLSSVAKSARSEDSLRIETDEVLLAPPPRQTMVEPQSAVTTSFSKGELHVKPKKKWGILGKIRRGNHTRNKDAIIEEASVEDASIVEVESEVESHDTRNEELVGSPHAVPTIPSGPSKSFESGEQNSRISRYHIIQAKESDESSGRSSESGSKSPNTEIQQDVQKSQSVESIRRLDTSKSDWDQSKNFQRRKVLKPPPVKEIAGVILAPNRSVEVNSKLSTVPHPPKPTESDWDQSLNPSKVKMQKISIANLSAEESAASETASSFNEKVAPSKSTVGTPISVDTRKTKDIRSTQGNAGVETIAETEVDGTQAHSCDETSVPYRENDSTSSVSAMVVSRNVSRTSIPEEQEPNASRCEESTKAGKDSLINFVISPRRANIITPGGGRPFENERGDEPSKIIVPKKIKPADKPYVMKDGTTSIDDYTSELPSIIVDDVKPNKQPKLMKRITGIFATRKVKGHTNKGELYGVERQDSIEKDIVQAVSDGNINAFEDNLNAEIAPSDIFSPHKIRSREQTPLSDASIDGSEIKTPTVVLEQALSNAVTMAEEANLEVATAPFPHRKSRRNTSVEKRPVPRDLVDAIRMQNGLERNRRNNVSSRKENSGDAPGTSMHIETDAVKEAPRLDPPKEDGSGYRVLAPTPRKKSSNVVDDKATKPDGEKSGGFNNEDKNDQRRITELLYGPSSSFDNFNSRPKKVAVKGVYIGDLLDDHIEAPTQSPEIAGESTDEVGTSSPGPATGSHDDTEHDVSTNSEEREEEIPDKENENSIVSPKAVAVTPKTRLNGGRRSMLFGIRNLMSSGQ